MLGMNVHARFLAYPQRCGPRRGGFTSFWGEGGVLGIFAGSVGEGGGEYFLFPRYFFSPALKAQGSGRALFAGRGWYTLFYFPVTLFFEKHRLGL